MLDKKQEGENKKETPVPNADEDDDDKQNADDDDDENTDDDNENTEGGSEEEKPTVMNADSIDALVRARAAMSRRSIRSAAWSGSSARHARFRPRFRSFASSAPDTVISGSSRRMSRRARFGTGDATLIGFGRMAFAYEGFAHDMTTGTVDPHKVCIACSKCTEIMRAGGTTGCPIRDQEIYLPIYRETCNEKIKGRRRL